MSNENDKVTYVDVKDGINQISQSINQIVRNSFNFIKKNFLILLLFLIIGGILGYLKDTYDKKYVSTLIVSPNFNTVDYLHEKIGLLEAKIKDNDSLFFVKYQVPREGISKVSIKPIVDLYNLTKKDPNYFDTFKTLSQNASATRVIKDYTTSKNFPKHLITVKSSIKIDEKAIQEIMQFLNESDFYERARKKNLENIKDEITVNTEVIRQIDAILNRVPIESAKSTVYFNENSELKDLVSQKLKLVERNYELKINSDSLEYIVTPEEYFLNMINSKGLNGKYKYVLPFVLVFCFAFISFLRRMV